MHHADADVQVCGISGNLVSKALGGNNGNLVADSLVGLEVKRELGVVSLNDDLVFCQSSILYGTLHLQFGFSA